MTDAAAARAFIAKWDQNAQKESSAAKERFVDLCRLLGVRTPNDPGSGPDTYCAYGWPYDLGDDEILARLLGLNLERAAGGERCQQLWRLMRKSPTTNLHCEDTDGR